MSTYSVGQTVKFQLACGDTYLGEIVSDSGYTIRMRNYAIWYDHELLPRYSSNPDAIVTFEIADDTEVRFYGLPHC